MSITLDPREILAHLNSMGYKNIDAHQLKAFMQDLQRLMIYEQQKPANRRKHDDDRCPIHQHHIHRHRIEETHKSDSGEADDEGEPPYGHRGQDVFDVLHKSETAASRARKKTHPKPNSEQKQFITVHINKPQRQTCQVHHKEAQNVVENIVPPIDLRDSGRTDEKNNVLTASSSAATVSKVPSSVASKKSAKSCKSSYIKAKVMPKPFKSDPVALYHHYKQEWDKIKFPGEHQHGETRWAIREKLLGA